MAIVDRAISTTALVVSTTILDTTSLSLSFQFIFAAECIDDTTLERLQFILETLSKGIQLFGFIAECFSIIDKFLSGYLVDGGFSLERPCLKRKLPCGVL